MAVPTPGPKRKIYRGGYENNDPQQIELPAAAGSALKPGNIVSVLGTAGAHTLGLSAASAGGAFYIVKPPMHKGIDYVYAPGETVFAYIPRSRDVYLVRTSAALTVLKDAILARDGAGRVVAAGANPVLGYSEFDVTAAPVDTLIDFRIP